MTRNDEAALEVLRQYLDLQAQRRHKPVDETISHRMMQRWELLRRWRKGHSILIDKLSMD